MATIAESFTRTWRTPTSVLGWFTTVDHKRIGVRYIVTAYLFFLVAGLGALAMRTQLAHPDNTLLSPETYDQFFTMHGTTMIFLFSTPILFGFGNFMIPLLIGARDMAFPRLNAFGYWVFLFAGLFLYSGFITGAPDAGWFNYVPLSGLNADPGHNIDYYTLGLLFLGISTVAGGINFIVTIFKLRAPGMSINRMPIFVWAILVTSFAVVFAIPALNAANGMLELDRKAGTDFFNTAAGGNALLWQHLFWTFGHPDVYIIFLPAIGMVSMIVPVFSRHSLSGHVYVAMATVATGIVSFGVWVHHMFAVGLPNLSYAFFSAATALIAIPSGVQFVAWLATIWKGRVVWKTPFLWVAGFIVVFFIGGATGVMFSAVPFDQQVTDSYFVVAHFHYVLFGGAVFPIFGGLYYWLPKMTGRLLDERLGWINFWLVFIGFNLTFFPMHFLGLWGMPRRVYTYAPDLGWSGLNLLETAGAYVLALGILIFIINFFWSLGKGQIAGDDPWHANTLEWATSSPPPPYNFRAMPVVRSVDPLWDQPTIDEQTARQEPAPIGRSTLGTSLMDAQPEELLTMPPDSWWPLIVALSLAAVFVGILVEIWWISIVGGVVGTIAIMAWEWPTAEAHGEERAV